MPHPTGWLNPSYGGVTTWMSSYNTCPATSKLPLSDKNEYSDNDAEKLALPERVSSIPFLYTPSLIDRLVGWYRGGSKDFTSLLETTYPEACHVTHLRMTVEFYKTINMENDYVCNLVEQIGEQSIKTEGFNERYAKFYKRLKQAIFSLPGRWVPGDDPDLPEVGITSWKEIQDKLADFVPATPEILIPPELLFPWDDIEAPTDVKDYINCDTPTVDIDLHTVKSIVYEFLAEPKHYPMLQDFIASALRVESCFKVKKAKETICEPIVYDIKGFTESKYLGIATWIDNGMPEDNYALETPIWKRPTETRDAVVLTPNLSFQVWNLNEMVKACLIPNSGECSTLDQETIYRFHRKHRYFIYTDWKKSGLTIPHSFVKIVVDRIKEFFPHLKFPTCGFPILLRSGEWVIPTKDHGYGLGMVNNVCTLFNLVLFKYAKKMGIFEDRDDMLSFNDDSVIGTNSEESYEKWLDLCNRSGGLIDYSKTCITRKGPLLCEVYSLLNSRTDLKYVSWFHTLYGAFLNTVNYGHWRNHITGLWASVELTTKGCDRSRKYKDCLDIMVLMGETIWCNALRIWHVPLIQGYVELGGVSILFDHRSELNLSNLLVHLESLNKESPKDFIKLSNRLVRHKKKMAYKPVHRPWKRIPPGSTYNFLTELGNAKGISGEMKRFHDIIYHPFSVRDKRWMVKEFWENYGSPDTNTMELDFWAWCSTVSWPGYDVPCILVTESIGVSEQDEHMYSFNIKDCKKNPYSQLVNTMAYMYTNPKPRWVDFRDFSSIGVTIANIGGSKTIVEDITTIENIQNYGSVPRIQLSYAIRTGCVIHRMKGEKSMSKNAHTLFIKAFPEAQNDLRILGRNIATWYTKKPIPVSYEAEAAMMDIPFWLHTEFLIDFYKELTGTDKQFMPESFSPSLNNLEELLKKFPKQEDFLLMSKENLRLKTINDSLSKHSLTDIKIVEVDIPTTTIVEEADPRGILLDSFFGPDYKDEDPILHEIDDEPCMSWEDLIKNIYSNEDLNVVHNQSSEPTNLDENDEGILIPFNVPDWIEPVLDTDITISDEESDVVEFSTYSESESSGDEFLFSSDSEDEQNAISDDGG